MLSLHGALEDARRGSEQMGGFPRNSGPRSRGSVGVDRGEARVYLQAFYGAHYEEDYGLGV